MSSESRPSARSMQSARSRRAAAAGAVLLALALAACASFGGGQKDQQVVDPNLKPADYKASIMAMLQNDPYGLVGAREAALSPPELKPFGSETRYVACLHASGADWSKEKMIVFYAGAINQFVDATREACGGAAYQPFPEVIALLARLSGSKK